MKIILFITKLSHISTYCPVHKEKKNLNSYRKYYDFMKKILLRQPHTTSYECFV